ncbi:hypothetical protein AKJ48_00870 [candidate division MSBL1 archaeon SCGC-AAA261O19]|uniref:MoaD family protein n=2 Tax=candidate division MSBL1 TaxID=215777 RepID=A0A133V1W2_9EURY|nr:hypothetical protein AKJ42_00930 [candidate division MSBL1 archaeon SCGC-AAA261C02]KXB04917.1 hypothetical protein AKJ48_00870 [candidate division MSBL1 archaeon SCGC-AAA261O19]
MRVKVKLFAIFQELAGKKQVTVSAADVRGLLQKLTTQYGELEGRFFEDSEGRELRGGINIMVNGRNIRFLDGLDTRLKDDDLVAIFPPVGGG